MEQSSTEVYSEGKHVTSDPSEMREHNTGKQSSQRRDSQQKKAPEAGTSMAWGRAGVIKEEHAADKIRERPCPLGKDFGFYSLQWVRESCMKVLQGSIKI